MHCSACGHANPDANLFCGQCGARLASSAANDSWRPLGERRQVTILFADLAGFTRLTRTLDAEDVHNIMDDCFKIILDEIHRHERTVIQFTGDGAMAIFRAPIAHEAHAQQACRASSAIQRNTISYGEQIKNDYGVDFKMRIGLNSGPVTKNSRIL